MKKTKLSIAVSAVSLALLSPVTLAEEQITDQDFSNGIDVFTVDTVNSDWSAGFLAPSAGSVRVANDQGCVQIDNSGTETWHIQLRQTGLNFVEDETYNVSFDVVATADTVFSVGAADETGGFVSIFEESDIAVDTTGLSYSAEMTAEATSDNANFRFMLGGNDVPADTEVCFSNVSVDDNDTPPPTSDEFDLSAPVSDNLNINQHGYLPALAKKATYTTTSESSAALDWAVFDGSTKLLEGTSTHLGVDSGSEKHVHEIDFSELEAEGDNLKLFVNVGNTTHASHAFDISDGLYEDLQYESLAYFYHNRSGVAIEADVVGANWARPAGHTGDNNIQTFSCVADSTSIPNWEYITDGVKAECRTLDASGGWYDAGDHGKYVVNGAFSVWVMLNQYERATQLGNNASTLADGTMMLPSSEKTNGVPDILDEARFQMEWLLKMQIPQGSADAGMVYHKMNTHGWTAIPTAPVDDDGARYAQDFSTAATLNLAASAAQCARIFETIDSSFSALCLDAAENAYTAALADDNTLAPVNDYGAGIYGDENLEDEFLWAALELYLTTGKDAYKDKVLDHDLYKAELESPLPPALFSWQNTSFLGLMSAAIVGDSTDAITQSAVAKVKTAGKGYAEVSSDAGYGITFEGEDAYWGSNSFTVNNAMIMGIANDIECDSEIIDALQNGMSYLMGRNPLNQSYITGYGENASQNPHHRFWAKSKDASYPEAPAGVLIGGPNTGLEDELSETELAGCAALECYLDDIDAWSTNEITINWNAPLAWTAAYMNELSSTISSRADLTACKITLPEPMPTPSPAETPDTDPTPTPSPDVTPDPDKEPTGGDQDEPATKETADPVENKRVVTTTTSSGGGGSTGIFTILGLALFSLRKSKFFKRLAK